MGYSSRVPPMRRLLVLFLLAAAAAAQSETQSGVEGHYHRRLRHHQRQQQQQQQERQERQERETTVNEVLPPGAVGVSEFIVTHSNGSVFLGCHIARPVIVWRHNGHVKDLSQQQQREGAKSAAGVTTTSKKRFFSEYLPSSGRHVLQISPVDPTDFGSWSCQAAEEEAEEKSWSLVVLPEIEKLFVFDSLDEDPHHFKGNDAVITVQEGETLTLYCAMLVRKSKLGEDSSTKDFLKWSSNNELDLSSQLSSHHFVQNNDELVGFLSQLTLVDVGRAANLEQIQCSGAFPGKSTYKLHVQYPPTFTIRRTPGFGIPILSGMTVSLECEADVQPRVSGRWVKDDSPVTNTDGNGTVIIEEVSVGDTGWYQCFIEYNGNEYSSIGYFLGVKPQMFEVSSAVAAEERTPFSLPRRNNSSAAEEDMLETNDINVEYSDHRPNCSLSEEDQQYQRPKIVPRNSSVISVIFDQESVVLSFEVCSNPRPSRVLWATPTHTLRPGMTVDVFTARNLTRLKNMEVTCYSVELEVKDPKGHLGEYVLVVKNLQGVSDGVMVLTGVMMPSTAAENHFSCQLLLTLVVFVTIMSRDD